MNIKKTEFEHNFHGSKKVGNNTYGFYPLHNVDIYNRIIIDDIDFIVVYQTGCGFEHSDYACPDRNLNISSDGGTSKLITKLWSYTETELETISTDDAEDLIEELNALCPSIKSIDDAITLYAEIIDNNASANAYFSALELSDDLDDYEVDEETDELTEK